MHLNQTSVSYISDSFPHFAHKIGIVWSVFKSLCWRVIEHQGWQSSREQLGADQSRPKQQQPTEADQAKARQPALLISEKKKLQCFGLEGNRRVIEHQGWQSREQRGADQAKAHQLLFLWQAWSSTRRLAGKSLFMFSDRAKTYCNGFYSWWECYWNLGQQTV